MVLNEFEEFREYYTAYLDAVSGPGSEEKIARAREEMNELKEGDKFFFTPRFLPMDRVSDHIRRCENTIAVINRILKETREGEKTPLTDIIPKKRQYNIPSSMLYEKAIELVDPKFPSIMESRIDGCVLPDWSLMSYEINANRAGWENSRAFCDIYNRHFSNVLPGYTIDFADGWERIIKHILGRIGGGKVMYLTEQTGEKSVNALGERGIDIDFVRFQDMEALKVSGDLSITKDDVVYKGERVDLICRFLRTHQVLEVPGLCECVKAGNVHLINQMDAFFGGLKTLMIKLRDPNEISAYADPADLINIPRSYFLRDMEPKQLEVDREKYVLKFGNRGGGKAVYFGTDMRKNEWKDMLDNSVRRYPETAMIQDFIEPSLTPVYEGGGISLQNTTCDVFVFSTDKPSFGGVFSRCSYENLVNFKTGGIKQTVFI
ncbi:MAG: hypothetical protein JW724_02870 [Candidatus Altiarchaeota archaeon]|nr:hypothetical protein [Candidatus Altiarchaeota archaeon]